jgi:hypothetical protein
MSYGTVLFYCDVFYIFRPGRFNETSKSDERLSIIGEALMNVLRRTLNGALNRVRHKGLIETLHYSALVAPGRLKDIYKDIYIDLRYGRKLASYRDLRHLGLPDVTAIEPTSTHVLEDVFALEPINPDDVLCDVGCGDGRVIAWWVSQGLQNKILGLELDSATALSTSCRFERYSNVRILHCDATHMLPVATVFYLFNPFTGDMMRRFADQIMRQPHAKVISRWRRSRKAASTLN